MSGSVQWVLLAKRTAPLNCEPKWFGSRAPVQSVEGLMGVVKFPLRTMGEVQTGIDAGDVVVSTWGAGIASTA